MNFEANKEFMENLYLTPDCARKMLESCLLACQKVAEKLPKVQNVAT